MVQRVRCCSDWNACHAFVNNNMHGWKCTTATNVTNMRSHCYKIKHKWGKVHSCVVILFSMPHLNVWIMINGTCHVKKTNHIKRTMFTSYQILQLYIYTCQKVSHWTMLNQNITTYLIIWWSRSFKKSQSYNDKSNPLEKIHTFHKIFHYYEKKHTIFLQHQSNLLTEQIHFQAIHACHKERLQENYLCEICFWLFTPETYRIKIPFIIIVCRYFPFWSLQCTSHSLSVPKLE